MSQEDKIVPENEGETASDQDVEDTGLNGSEGLDDLDLDGPLTVKSRWPMYLALVLVLAAVGAAVYFFLFDKTTQPNKFVMGVKVVSDDGEAYWWQGDEAARELAQQLSEQLEDLGLEHAGFDSEAKDALEGAVTPEDIRAAAVELEAGFVILGEATVVRSAPLDGKQSDFGIELTLRFMDVDSGEIDEVERMPLEFFEWATSPTEALAAASARMAAAGVAPLVNAMAQNERLSRLNEKKDELSYDEAKIVSDMESFFIIASYFDNQMKQREEHEKKEKLENEDIEQSPLERTRLGEYLAAEYFVGAATNDQVVLLTEPHYVEVRTDEGEYGIRRESERLVMAGDDERSILFEHFNFYSFPDVADNGEVAAAVLDNRQRSKWLVAINIPEGDLTLLAQHVDHYYSSPEVSPDGSRVSFFYRRGRRAQSALEVINTDGSGRQELVPVGFDMSLPSWGPDNNTLYIALGVDGDDSIVAIDIEKGTQTFLLGSAARPIEDSGEEGANEEEADPDGGSADEIDDPNGDGADETKEEDETVWNPRWDSTFDRAVASPDGTFLIVREWDQARQPWIGRYDIESQEYRRLLDIQADRLIMSPDGKYVAMETRGLDHPDDPGSRDTDVIIVSTDGGEPIPVTLNAVRDDLGGWSQDGKSVFVQQSSRDPKSRRYASRVYRYNLP